MRPIWYTKARLGYWVHFEQDPKMWRVLRPKGLLTFDEAVHLVLLDRDMNNGNKERYTRFFA